MLVGCKNLIENYHSLTEGLNFPALRGLLLGTEKSKPIAIIESLNAGKSPSIQLKKIEQILRRKKVHVDKMSILRDERVGKLKLLSQ